MIDITVIIAVYNETIKDLKRSINSILNQTYKNFEIIIVLDNPDRADLVDFLEKNYSNNNQLKFVFNEKNMGQCLARNRAISMSENEFIMIMDADDYSVNYRMKMQIDFMVEHKLDLCFSNFSIVDESFEVTRYSSFVNNDIYDQKKMKNILADHSISIGPTFMFKKSSFNNIGKYRDMNVEDYDLSTRMLVDGYRVGYISNPLLKKNLRKSSISYGSLYNQYVIMKEISKSVKKSSFREYVSIDNLNSALNNISDSQRKAFERYSNSRYDLNDKRSIKNMFRVFYHIFTSLTVVRYITWSIKNRIINSIL